MPSIRVPRSRAWSLLSALLLFVFTAGLSPVRAQAVPDRVLVGYWHNWGFSPNNLTLANLPAAYDVFNVSFAVPTTVFGATMTFAPDPNLYPNPMDFLADVRALQMQGKKVLISIGGANGPVHLDTTSDVTAFVTSMANIINTWGFDGLDIDLEGGSLSLAPGDTDFANPTTPKIVNFITAMNQLLAQMPADFMPNGPSSYGIRVVGGQAGHDFFYALSTFPENATQPGAGLWYGLHIDIGSLAVQFDIGQQFAQFLTMPGEGFFLGTLDAAGEAYFQFGGAFPAPGLTVHGNVITWDPATGLISDVSCVVESPPLF